MLKRDTRQNLGQRLRQIIAPIAAIRSVLQMAPFKQGVSQTQLHDLAREWNVRRLAEAATRIGRALIFGRKDFLPVETQSCLSFLFLLLGKPRFA
jgi:hypothetical protein